MVIHTAVVWVFFCQFFVKICRKRTKICNQSIDSLMDSPFSYHYIFTLQSQALTNGIRERLSKSWQTQEPRSDRSSTTLWMPLSPVGLVQSPIRMSSCLSSRLIHPLPNRSPSQASRAVDDSMGLCRYSSAVSYMPVYSVSQGIIRYRGHVFCIENLIFFLYWKFNFFFFFVFDLVHSN